MPLRDVVIRLGLDASGYIAGVEKAKLATAGLGGDLTKVAAQRQGIGILGSSFGALALAGTAAGVALVKGSADFEKAMASVNSTGAASQKQLAALREEALLMGRTTVYSATEAAGGMEALLKAGVSAKDVIGGGLKGALNLAAAGSMDVGDASEIAASAMTQFGLNGKDVVHIADLLAAGAGKAQGDVSDLGFALNQAGLVAHGAGANIEETTATLTAFASAGLIGSDAGTSFRTMLQRLEAPQGRARKELARWNISAYDSKGNFVGMARLAGQLQRAFHGQSAETRNAALSIIFGQDAVRGANVLYKQGEKGIQKWTDAVNDSGYAAEVAQKKNDSLQGDLKKLSNAWGSLAAGSNSSGGVRPIVRGLTQIGKELAKIDQDPAFQKIFNSGNPFPTIGNKLSADAGGTGSIGGDLKLGLHSVGQDFGFVDKSPRNVGSSAIADRDIKFTADIGDVLSKGAQANRFVNSIKQKRPSPIDADANPAKRKTQEVDRAINGLHQTNKPVLDVDISKIAAKVQQAAQLLASLNSLGAIGLPHFAIGGPVYGPGNGTSDSIPAMLSNGEHVLTASDVRMAGGQGSVYRMRAAIQSGDLKFASGGAAGSSFQQRQLAIARLQSDIVQNRTSRKTEKGYWPRRVLDLEYAEDRRALYRLQHGVDESTNPADEVQSAIQSLRDAATAPVSLFDGASDSPWMQAGGFGSRAQQKLTQIRTLAGKLVQLRKAGLNGALLAEIYGLGSAQGIAAADELLRNRGEIRQLNAAYTGIQAANGLVAAASFQSPGAVGGVRISLDGVSFNLQDMKATVRVVARDEAGHVLAQDRFESVVH